MLGARSSASDLASTRRKRSELPLLDRVVPAEKGPTASLTVCKKARSVQYILSQTVIPIRYYNSHVELRHLRYFIAVAEALNFTKAAQRLHIAQPPLSRQIRQLEEEIGVQLLIRDRRRVELTDSGRVLLKEARILVAQTAHAVDAARCTKRGATGIVRIGMGLGLGEQVNRVLMEHARRFPAVEIQCEEIVSTHQNEALREHRIDVGFLRPPVDSVHLVSEAICEERFLVLQRPLGVGDTYQEAAVGGRHRD